MATTSPDNILTPDAGDQYALVQDLGIMADSVQAALNNKQSNVFRGTASQRATAQASALNGMLWQDTDGIRMLWKRGATVWEPAVWRWAGTTAQMNAFTQAPNGFEWFNSTTNSSYTKLSGAWRIDQNVIQSTTTTYLQVTSTSFQATSLSASITPSATTSRILVSATFVMGTAAAGASGRATIFRGGIGGTNLGGASGIMQVWAGSSAFRTSLSQTYLDSPASVSAQTYTVAIKSDSGSIDFIPASTLATIVLTEIR